MLFFFLHKDLYHDLVTPSATPVNTAKQSAPTAVHDTISTSQSASSIHDFRQSVITVRNASLYSRHPSSIPMAVYSPNVMMIVSLPLLIVIVGIIVLSPAVAFMILHYRKKKLVAVGTNAPCISLIHLLALKNTFNVLNS